MAKKKPRIGLVDADLLNGGTRHPNLLLMKLSGFLKGNNFVVELITTNTINISKYKIIYISKVFSFSPDPQFYTTATKYQKRKFRIGGTGMYATKTNVPAFKQFRERDMHQIESDPFLSTLPNKYNIEERPFGIDLSRQMPDYNLYDDYIEQKVKEGRNPNYYSDYKRYSIGFLTRGCIRHCPFCVNKLENEISAYSKLEWFICNEKDDRGRLIRPYIYLWDDNFLAAPKEIWKPQLEALMKLGRPFQFRQGLDERIIAESPDGEEIAKMLSQCKYHGDFIFAFDNWQDREKIIKALKIWRKYNPNKGTKFYLFCGYRMTPDNIERFYEDICLIFKRIEILMKFGCVGYVMRHEDYHNSPLPNLYVQIARWCNQQAFYKKMSFWEFVYRNQSFWEETTKKIVGRPKQKNYDEFIKDVKAGYYDNVRMCLPLRTIVELFDMFPEHVDELLDLFSLKFEILKKSN